MNDGYRGQDPYDPYAHDPYAQQAPPSYDTYDYGQGYEDQQGGQDQYYQDPGYQGQQGQQGGQGYQDPGYQDPGYGYGYDPYGQQPQQQAPPPPPYAQQAPPQHPQQAPPAGYDPYGPATSTNTQGIPAQRQPEHAQREYHTEQFSFVEDTPDESEDVIDWLKFTESRTERREEAKRRGRNRRTMLVMVLVLALLGGSGYLWATDRLGFLPGSGTEAAVAGEEKRDVIVVHLRETDGGGNATALMVDNSTTKKGTTVLLPNDLAVSGDDGSAMALGQAVEDEGAGATRDAIDRLLGSQIKGTWRLDTPYLEILVEGVGGITIDADATVPGEKKGEEPFVKEGKARDIDGREAIAYATYQGPDEPQTAQLERFGQVMAAVLKKLPSDVEGVRSIVTSLGMITDPSLSEAQLSASLAGLATLAKDGAYGTETLAVGEDGRPSEEATASVVKDVLGGTVKAPAGDAPARVSVKNAAGGADAAESAKVSLVNGGFTFIDGGKADAAATSKVLYADAAGKAQAEEVAKTLGLSGKAVAKGETAANADVTVVLGKDYEG